MLSEELVSTVCGPPIVANTAVSKDIGIYAHSLTPSWAVKASFKKSSTPPNCLAVNSSHIYTAQDQKAHVHVYSRLRGNQETFVSFQERIRSVALADDVLLLGTAEGRLILWETCTGRQIATPPCHVQAISCLAVTLSHVLTASEDSNINVWSLARLLEYGAEPSFEPERTLSNHRAAITSLVVSPGENPDTSLCVSSSRDKTCIIWNYQTSQVLRTLLFSSVPLCVTLDPCARALLVSAEDRSIYLVEFYGNKPILGARSVELASLVTQVDSPIGVADEDAGPATCLALNYDGTTLVTGHTKGRVLRWNLADKTHPTELANLNAAVTNLRFIPLISPAQTHQTTMVVKPNHAQKNYTITKQLTESVRQSSRFTQMMESTGFPNAIMKEAIQSLSNSSPNGDAIIALQKQNEELQEIVKEQKELQRATIAHYGESKT